MSVPADRLWRPAFLVAVVANLVVLYWPRAVSSGGVPHLDKAVHLAVFAVLVWTGLKAGLPAYALLPVVVVHAVSSEVVQQLLLARRSGDPADVVADLVGTLAGWGLARASWRGEPARPA